LTHWKQYHNRANSRIVEALEPINSESAGGDPLEHPSGTGGDPLENLSGKKDAEWDFAPYMPNYRIKESFKFGWGWEIFGKAKRMVEGGWFSVGRQY